MSRFRHYHPPSGKFTSMNQTFNSREASDKALAYYIERTKRGIRLDTLPWVYEEITVEVEEDNPEKIIW